MMKNFLFGGLLSSLLLWGGCTSFPRQSAYEASLHRGSVEIDLSTPSSDGIRFQMQGKSLEGALIRGIAQPEGTGYRLIVTNLDWFHNWTEGWTEATFDVTGTLNLSAVDGGWKVSVVEIPTIEAIQKANLRLYGDYFSGDTAQGLVERRWERIQAVVPVLNDLGFASDYESLAPEFRWEAFHWTKNFQESVRQRLFPEVYGYPPGTTKGTEYTIGESIAWDVTYTHQTFPELLWEVRQSGTLYRDFEESSGLWLLAVSWKSIWDQQIPATVFRQK